MFTLEALRHAVGVEGGRVAAGALFFNGVAPGGVI